MTYALLANPHQNFYPTRRQQIRFIGLHVTAGLQDLDLKGIDHSASATNQYGATTSTQASWHKIVDSDSIEDALPDDHTAWHIVGYNSPSLGLEICNQDAVWNNKPADWVDATLRNAATVCHKWEKDHGIPRQLLSRAEVDAGKWGYSYHMWLNPSTRHDPGVTFPWAKFVGYLEELDGKKPYYGICTKLQKAVRVDADNYWGDDTEKACNAIRWAAQHKFPSGVEYTQARIGTKVDGDWGPNSEAAYALTVIECQKALEEMAHVDLMLNGVWDTPTELAYQKVRKICKR